MQKNRYLWLLKGFWYWGEIGEVLLWVAGVLTFITGYQYFQKSLDYICETEKCAKMPAMPKIALPKIDVNSVKAKKNKSVKKTSVKTKNKVVKSKKASSGKKVKK